MITCAACTSRYATRFDFRQGTCDHDSTAILNALTRSDLSIPDASLDRAPRVDVVTLSTLHMIGRDLYRTHATFRDSDDRRTWSPRRQDLDTVVASTFERFGGVTLGPDGPVDPSTGYAVTVRRPGIRPESYALDHVPWDALLVREVSSPYLGVFRDDSGAPVVDVDPVAIVSTLREAQALGVYCASTGGAYNFADGLGYWTPTTL